MPRIAFENITKQFGTVSVLKDLSLTVDDGDFLVLLGPSGCGKTTLLNMLAGLTEVTSGTLRIGERDVTDLDPKDRGLAMVFQSYALYPTKTVRGNLKFGLSARKLDPAEIKRRIGATAKLLQIEPLMERKPAQLSGGQRQRVAIGRALVKESNVLLFDEPLSNLDAKLRTETRLEIKRLHDHLKQTMVYVTHDQIEAMTMATKIAVMNGGVIQQFGTPDEIYETPANLFVAGFIGSPAMNFLNAHAIKTKIELSAEIKNNGMKIALSSLKGSDKIVNGDGLVLGLRPEHFHIGTSRGDVANFNLPIRQTEKTGHESIVYCELRGQLLAVRADSDTAGKFKKGQSLPLWFPRDKINVFAEKTSLRL